ncbi:MAG: 4Fe-4S dicluster domain-containing protein [Eggerthellaceae bacterium]|nr:4Fe-4S dicluster domain-containing protein [Eggerthellaceae bacterium]
MTRYAMAIDKKRCMGCNRCSVSCIAEHNLPDGMIWSRAKSNNEDYYRVAAKDAEGKLKMEFYTFACQHCSKPACVAVCPTGASYQREDGIVAIDLEKCIGCKSCINSCPYTGVRTHQATEPAYQVDFKLGDWAVDDHRAGVVEKCTFCKERVDRGEAPRCVISCQARARYFGDVEDPTSEISQILATREYDQLLVEAGTEPNVYFLK